MATEYIVLFCGANDTGPEGYAPLPLTFTAASADAAIRAAAEHEKTNGSYVAIPARSWKPRELTVETKPKVTFS